jgi:hypothetical protein
VRRESAFWEINPTDTTNRRHRPDLREDSWGDSWSLLPSVAAFEGGSRTGVE